MQIGVIGLGRMGSNIVRRLLGAGHRCVVLDKQPAPRTLSPGWRDPERSGACCRRARSPNRPSRRLCALMEPGDTLIDRGNSFYKYDNRRAANLGAKNIRYLDVGSNGGVWGFERRSLYTRFRSREAHIFGEKMLSAMHNKFGGHVEPGKRK